MGYRRIGDLIRLVDQRNKDLSVTHLVGLTINKKFIPSVANIIGTDMSNYKLIRKNQFACSTMQVRRDKKMPIALLKDFELAIISQAYPVFEIKDENEISPDYLMLWFSRSEFDREACFHAVGGVRGSLEWEDFCGLELPVPSIEDQRQIVAQYQAITNKILINEQICSALQSTAQTLYKYWFIDFEFPDENGKPYKSSGGKMQYNEELEKEVPKEWQIKKLKKIANLKYGKMLDADKFLSEGYPVFSGYGVRGHYSEYMYEDSQILVLCRGVSGTGEVKLSPEYSYITNLSIIVELNKKVVCKYFVYFYLKNDNLRSLDSGSAQSMITTGDLYFRNILVPSYDIQKAFDYDLKKIDKYKLSMKDQNQKLTQLQSLLLSRLATIEKNSLEYA